MCMCVYKTNNQLYLDAYVYCTRTDGISFFLSRWLAGAILIREGFSSYSTLQECDRTLQKMKNEVLQYVADKQIIAEIDYYHENLESFLSIMADLGLMRVVNKAQEVANLMDEEDPKENLDVFKPTSPAFFAPAKPASSPDVAPPKRTWVPSFLKPATPAPAPAAEISPGADTLSQPDSKAPSVSAPGSSSTAPVVTDEPQNKAPPKPKPKPKTINITTTHKNTTGDDTGKGKGGAAKEKGKPAAAPPVDKESDLPRTAKPKKAAKLPGSNNVGRGTGRQLSKDEAKEQSRTAIKVKPPPDAKWAATPPSAKPNSIDDDEEEEDENEQDSNSEDEEKDDKEDGVVPQKSPNEEPSNDAPQDGPKKNNQGGKEPQGDRGGAAGTAPNRKKTSKKAAPAPEKKVDPRVPIVVMHGKEEIKFVVDPKKETLGQLKKQLEQKTGMPLPKQRISLRMVGQELQPDEKNLHFFAVIKDTVLDMDAKSIQVNVEMPDGKPGEPSLTLEEIVPAMDTSDTLKNKIEQETGLAAVRQVLMFQGEEFVTKKTVKEMGILNGSTIKVELFSKVPITVKTLDDKQIKLMVDLAKDKPEDIKVQLEKKIRVKVDNQRLFNSADVALEDEDDLNKSNKDKDKKKGSSFSIIPWKRKETAKKVFCQDYGVAENSVISVEPKIINVKVVLPDGKKLKGQVPMRSTDMSDLIRRLVETKTEMTAVSNPTKHIFKFGGKKLPKGETAKQMGLREGSEVKLEVNDWFQALWCIISLVVFRNRW